MTPKLTEAFNKHADKLIDVVAMDHAVFAALEQKLDETETQAFLMVASTADPMSANLPAGTKIYVGNNSEGEQSVFISVGAISAAFAKNAGLYGDVQAKVEDVFAEVLDKAADYKADADAGKLKAFPVPKR